MHRLVLLASTAFGLSFAVPAAADERMGAVIGMESTPLLLVQAWPRDDYQRRDLYDRDGDDERFSDWRYDDRRDYRFDRRYDEDRGFYGRRRGPDDRDYTFRYRNDDDDDEWEERRFEYDRWDDWGRGSYDRRPGGDDRNDRFEYDEEDEDSTGSTVPRWWRYDNGRPYRT
jgi:hypothetical protein